MKNTIIACIGWYGVTAILGAYVLISFDVISSKGLVYQVLNLTGALSLIVEAGSKKDTQPVVLNVVWSVVALVAIVQLLVK